MVMIGAGLRMALVLQCCEHLWGGLLKTPGGALLCASTHTLELPCYFCSCEFLVLMFAYALAFYLDSVAFFSVIGNAFFIKSLIWI